MKHGERKHSKFSASGAERWFNCSASVALSEGLPDKDSVWSLEGTRAHEVLEAVLRYYYTGTMTLIHEFIIPDEMAHHAKNAARFILNLHRKASLSELMVETRIYLDFIHPEMFGTFDSAVVDHFGTLHVFDYKYGAGHAVSPKENLQMIFYGLALAHKFDWNFKRVRLWIIQPRVRGYDGPLFWELPILELKAYVPEFKKAVTRVLENPVLVEGTWCHWCKAKTKCPLKNEARSAKAKAVFAAAPLKQIGKVDRHGKERN